VYHLLGVGLAREHLRAESSYNDMLQPVIDALRAQGLLQESDGALCVFLDEFKGKDGNPLPLIVQKTGGGFLYATTDLAAIRYRNDGLRADRVLYFVDARQALHFRQVFAAARLAGFARPELLLEHCSFGSMLGADGKPFKSRSGDTVKLVELLEEAQRRAASLLAERGDLDEAARADVARAVGIGAVKYADLSKHRTNDYIFDWEQMLSFEGNTAPYLQYACTRIHSIFRRAGVAPASIASGGRDRPLVAEERVLALQLARFAETLDSVARESLPHYLCTYLYELSGNFMKFYEHCPVLDGDAQTRDGRLALCATTLAVLTKGLELLGIATVERM
jgi:arginyl-tRNA synthetase